MKSIKQEREDRLVNQEERNLPRTFNREKNKYKNNKERQARMTPLEPVRIKNTKDSNKLRKEKSRIMCLYRPKKEIFQTLEPAKRILKEAIRRIKRLCLTFGLMYQLQTGICTERTQRLM